MSPREVVLLAILLCAVAALAQPAASRLPADPPSSAEFREALIARRDALRSSAPPVSERERESMNWMLAANAEIRHTLLGHHVIVLATDDFAAAAGRNDFVLVLDLAYEVLRNLWGNDPRQRVGRRFIIWPDPAKPGGHSCNGRELYVHVGRTDWRNAGWFERYFHEMTHGFQFEHPAGCYMINGLFEGWAEFMQAAVCHHLELLGEPFAGRFDWYSEHFPRAAEHEYLQTRLPIEEIVAYDPSAGLLMELLLTTRAPAGSVDWGPVRRLLQEPLSVPRWVPWHLWPSLMAQDCMAHFGESRARPILAKYRFPLDAASLEAAVRQNHGRPAPDASPREPVRAWQVLGEFPNTERMGWHYNPLGAEDMAWHWKRQPALPAPPLPRRSAELAWRLAESDGRGAVSLAGDGGGPAYFYLATTLPDALRERLTLYVASDDECAVWLDGELVHLFRGVRSCEPGFPDVAYADARGGRGQILALVVNHGGPSAFSLAVARGGLLYEGFEQRIAGTDVKERAAAVAYVASRRHHQPVSRMLARAAADRSEVVRRAAVAPADERPRDPRGDYVEAEDAFYLGTIAGGFFGNNRGASGRQCVARQWGASADHWLSVPVEAKFSGAGRVRIRYACPNDAHLRVRLRRGEEVVFESERVQLPTTAGSEEWAWFDVPVPRLARGVLHVDLLEPSGAPCIDVVGLAPR